MHAGVDVEMAGHMNSKHFAVLNEIAVKCCAALATEPGITDVYLVGSVARGDSDGLSDIDLCAVVQRERLGLVLSRAEAIASTHFEVMAGGWFPGTACYSVLYNISGGIIKVDYDYVSSLDFPELLAESMENRTYLFDRKVLFKRQRCTEREQLEALSESPKCQRRSEASVAVGAWSVVRMARRGEILEAVDILNHIRDPLLTRLVCAVAGVPFENYRRLESKLPPELHAWLRRTFASPTRSDVLRALNELTSLYLHVSERLSTDVETSERLACKYIMDHEIACAHDSDME